MPSAEIITIGTELLLGQLVDTNTSAIAKAMADVGVDVYRETTVGDNAARIAGAVREALGRADIVLCAGGLGPTVDDLTRDAVADAVGRTLETHDKSLHSIEAIFASMGRTMSENNRRQALFPHGAIVVDNARGTAPGFIVEEDAHVIVAMPGPPHELNQMLHRSVVPWLKTRFELHDTLVTRVLHTVGVSESEIDARIDDLFRAGTNPSIAVLAHIGLVDVKLTAKAKDPASAASMIATLEPEVRRRLGDCICAVDSGTLQASLGKALRDRAWTIAAAESCSGGLVGAAIASVPGASDYFLGGVVAYANEAKHDLLGVDEGVIAAYGAVSEAAAAEMAAGARARFKATIAVSVTCIAGPDGGTPEKPVGLTYIGLANAEGTTDVKRFILPGDRENIARRAALAALTMAWRAARPAQAER